MASPTQNSVGFTSFDPAATADKGHLLSGTKWGGALGMGVTLTFSFPNGAGGGWHVIGYGEAEWDTWYVLNAAQKAAMRAGLADWASVANVHFVETVDTQATVGEIRFAGTSLDPNFYAHAYFPAGNPEAGDVWFGQPWGDASSISVPKGSYEYLTVIHELGHALGLKHSFDFPVPSPLARDDYFHTIMSYTAKAGVSGNYASFYPTTMMYDDLLAIQTLYGRNVSHNSGNTTYTFSDGHTYFQTIDDAGGIDKIVYNGTASTIINLNSGTFSSVSAPVTFGDNSTSRATVAIGPNSVIEQAFGGSGNDRIIGNDQVNVLNGGAGNDWIQGGFSVDNLNGGSGIDTVDYTYSTQSWTLILVAGTAVAAGSVGTETIVGFENVNGAQGNDVIVGTIGVNIIDGERGNDILTGGQGADTFVFNTALSAAANVDWITDFSAPLDTIQLENAVFTALAGVNTLSAGQFHIGAAAADANDHIIYNSATGNVFYDSNGAAAGGATQFAKLAVGLHLTAADFFII